MVTHLRRRPVERRKETLLAPSCLSVPHVASSAVFCGSSWTGRQVPLDLRSTNSPTWRKWGIQHPSAAGTRAPCQGRSCISQPWFIPEKKTRCFEQLFLPLLFTADYQTVLQQAADSGSLGKWGWACNAVAKGSALLLTEGPQSLLPPQRTWNPRAWPDPDLQGSPSPGRPWRAPSPPVRGNLTRTPRMGQSPHPGCQQSTKALTHRPWLQVGRWHWGSTELGFPLTSRNDSQQLLRTTWPKAEVKIPTPRLSAPHLGKARSESPAWVQNSLRTHPPKLKGHAQPWLQDGTPRCTTSKSPTEHAAPANTWGTGVPGWPQHNHHHIFRSPGNNLYPHRGEVAPATSSTSTCILCRAREGVLLPAG